MTYLYQALAERVDAWRTAHYPYDDNALAETINGLYKTELIHRQSWKSREAVELATLKWVHGLNHQRLLGSIGYIPPAEAEANFYRQQTGQAMAA